MPWNRVLLINQNLCENTPKDEDKIVAHHEVREPAGQKVRELWERAFSQDLTLFEAIDVCRRCCDLAAFTFHNGNTFSDVAKTIVEDWLNLLPGVEAQIVRTTIGHYVADHIVSRKEMVKVVEHFDTRWKINGFPKPAPTPTPSPDIAAQPQPHIAQA